MLFRSIGDVWGIGHKHNKRLVFQGVRTAYDFTQLSDAWVRREMSVVGLRLKHDLVVVIQCRRYASRLNGEFVFG